MRKKLQPIIFLVLPFCLWGQPFSSTPVINPFGITPAQSHYRFAFDDLDGDGDTDILALDQFGNGSPFIRWNNVGSNAAPQFIAASGQNPFGLQAVNFMNNFFLIDWDGDGDKDLFGGAANGFYHFLNTGVAGQPAFGPPTFNPFGLVAPAGSNTLIPTVGDLDGDGLRDLLVGDYNGNVFFYKNTGTAIAPAFALPMAAPFGYVKPVGTVAFLAPVLKDANDDGLLDLLVGYNPGRIRLYLNTGSATAPQFGPATANPFGLNFSNFNVWAMPIFQDMDGDGDDDLLVTTFPSIQYHENLRAVSGLTEPLSGRLDLYPNPATEEVLIALPEGLRQDCGGAGLQLNIRDVSGKIHASTYAAVEGGIRCSLSGLTAGLYFAEVAACGARYQALLVKQ